jgi:hypothetical protein
MTTKLEGLDETTAIFDALPQAVQDELILILAAIGRDALAIQRRLVPTKTGALQSALNFTASLEMLRLRVGLTDLKRRRDLWYAIIMEYGRHAGAKVVQRRPRGTAQVGKRRSKVQAAARYLLRAKWKALPARPFVHIDNIIDPLADAALADFWDHVKDRAGF